MAGDDRFFVHDKVDLFYTIPRPDADCSCACVAVAILFAADPEPAGRSAFECVVAVFVSQHPLVAARSLTPHFYSRDWLLPGRDSPSTLHGFPVRPDCICGVWHAAFGAMGAHQMGWAKAQNARVRFIGVS